MHPTGRPALCKSCLCLRVQYMCVPDNLSVCFSFVCLRNKMIRDSSLLVLPVHATRQPFPSKSRYVITLSIPLTFFVLLSASMSRCGGQVVCKLSTRTPLSFALFFPQFQCQPQPFSTMVFFCCILPLLQKSHPTSSPLSQFYRRS